MTKRQRLKLLTALCAALISEQLQADAHTDELYLWHRNFDTPHTRHLLELALQKTADEYGHTDIVRSLEFTQERALSNIVRGDIQGVDIINVVVDEKRESALLPIKVISDEGLIGYRVCLVHPDNRDLLKGVRSYTDLQTLDVNFGQGAHWPDTDILRQNGLKVTTSVSFESLFYMTKSRRFDCFLRGVNEVAEDLQQHFSEGLIVEPHLLFAYPSTSTFFVNKSNPDLAARLELGIRRAILDGSFETYFETVYREEIEQLHLDQRRIIHLNNPLISKEFLNIEVQRYILKPSLGDL